MFEFDTFYWTVLGALMLVHLLYDFHWQGDFIGQLKSKYDFLLGVHCLTYALCISAVLYFFGVFSIIKFLFVLVTHWFIDHWKCRQEDKTNNLTWDLWLDQALHVLVLIVIIYGA